MTNMSLILLPPNSENTPLRLATKDMGKGPYIDIGTWNPNYYSVSASFHEQRWHSNYSDKKIISIDISASSNEIDNNYYYKSTTSNTFDARLKPESPEFFSSITWVFSGFSIDDRRQSLSRFEMQRSIEQVGGCIVPEIDSLPGDINIVAAAPGELIRQQQAPAFLFENDGVVQGVPVNWVDSLNEKLAGIACTSRHSLKTLIDQGLSIPAAVVGTGVDHWERQAANQEFLAPGKSFRFLHVSNGNPDSGLDILLESFGYVFSAEDDVSLLILPGAPLPPAIIDQLDQLRKTNPYYPEILILEDDLSADEVKALYQQCAVLVAPARQAGFGMPVAQAILSGLPVIVTAWGGHIDYCDDANAWLVDFRYRRADVSDQSAPSVQAEPVAASLDGCLWSAYQASPSLRRKMASVGRQRLLEQHSWQAVTRRIAALKDAVQCVTSNHAQPIRIAWITSWNEKCGIANYTEHLVEELPQEKNYIFAPKKETQFPDKKNCLRNWEMGKQKNNFSQLINDIEFLSIGVVIIQFNYGFFNHFELNDLIEICADRGVVVIIDLHSSTDPYNAIENFCLRDFLGGLRKCHRILGHGLEDLERLKMLGLMDNVQIFPLGAMNRTMLSAQHRHNTPVLIASFGFCFPNKGLLELVEAVWILKQQGRIVHLRMLNAEHPVSVSGEEVRKIREMIVHLDLDEQIDFRTDFLSDETCLELLAESDLIVNPYQKTGESASSSVRYGLSVGRPVAVTPLPFFDDLGDAVFRLPGLTPALLAKGIAEVLDHIEQESETATHVEQVARNWVEMHDYARKGQQLVKMAEALAKASALERYQATS
ncbi:glycosyltransferase (plasmid) [Azospirillum sp. HJ39]|uniref:glycosyltransferase family 4 protein n=1 Tax=Azospirillum sp. HJ39 TaxID=3159496 RepID=UPI0035562DA5